MHLNYTIMWVDDEINAAGGDIPIRELQDYLFEKGFNLLPIKVESLEDLNDKIAVGTHIDFIFMDNTFNDKELGVTFIEKIREKRIYADILFYSSVTDLDGLKQQVRDSDIQSVYIFTKADVNENPAYATDIIDYRIQREMDDISLRGIGMAMIAEFDKSIFDILVANKKQDTILSKVRAKLEERQSDCEKKIKFDDTRLWNELKSERSTMIWDSSTRANSFFSIVQELPAESCTHQQKCEDYKERYRNVMKKRNNLAHHTDKPLEEIFCGQTSKETAKDMSIEFRQQLIEFKDIFSQIKKDWK